MSPDSCKVEGIRAELEESGVERELTLLLCPLADEVTYQFTRIVIGIQVSVLGESPSQQLTSLSHPGHVRGNLPSSSLPPHRSKHRAALAILRPLS